MDSGSDGRADQIEDIGFDQFQLLLFAETAFLIGRVLDQGQQWNRGEEGRREDGSQRRRDDRTWNRGNDDSRRWSGRDDNNRNNGSWDRRRDDDSRRDDRRDDNRARLGVDRSTTP